MRLTLVQSGRNFFQSAECTFASALAHLFVLWFAVGLSSGGRQMPIDEREARVFFLLPPDRVDVRDRQSEILQWGRLGGDLENGKILPNLEGGWARGDVAYGARGKRNRSGARGQLPVGPALTVHPGYCLQRAGGRRDGAL